MKTLYLQCAMGAAGDMLMAALYELLDEDGRSAFLKEINGLGIAGVQVQAVPAQKCGIWGTHMRVLVHGQEEHSADVAAHDCGEHTHSHDCDGHTHSHDCDGHTHSHDCDGHTHSHDCDGHTHSHDCDGHTHSHDCDGHTHSHDCDGHAHSHDCDGHAHSHSHSSLADISHLISHLPVSQKVRRDAQAVYGLIAEAESHAHCQPVSEIHFHEVGALDAVLDVLGVCLLMERIGAQKVLASPVHVGSGQVRCAHGVLPVPAPATAHILRGVPIYGGQVQGELCTPTGAALLKHFSQGFCPMPALSVCAIGYGMGTKDFDAANCVRAFLGEDGAGEGGPNGEAALLCCNLDDMTGEALGFAQEELLRQGALDVFTLPIQMKKSRPGVLLCCICQASDADALAAAILKHTTTLGVRRTICQRYALSRSIEEVKTPYGPLRIKAGQGYGAAKRKIEYEDAARIAREQGIPLAKVREILESLQK